MYPCGVQVRAGSLLTLPSVPFPQRSLHTELPNGPLVPTCPHCLPHAQCPNVYQASPHSIPSIYNSLVLPRSFPSALFLLVVRLRLPSYTIKPCHIHHPIHPKSDLPPPDGLSVPHRPPALTLPQHGQDPIRCVIRPLLPLRSTCCCSPQVLCVPHVPPSFTSHALHCSFPPTHHPNGSTAASSGSWFPSGSHPYLAAAAAALSAHVSCPLKFTPAPLKVRFPLSFHPCGMWQPPNTLSPGERSAMCRTVMSMSAIMSVW